MPRKGRDQINIAVDPSLKEDWKQAVEETGRYDSLTQLIRQSVENELIRIGFREGFDQDIPRQESSEVDVDLSSIEDELSEMKEELRGVNHRIEQISLATDAQQDTELMELASDLHEELPRVESPEGSTEESPADSGAREGQPWRLAKSIGEEEYDVTRALALLEQQMSRVKSTEVIVGGSPQHVYYVQI